MNKQDTHKHCNICGKEIDIKQNVRGITTNHLTYYFCWKHSVKELQQWIDDTLDCKKTRHR